MLFPENEFIAIRTASDFFFPGEPYTPIPYSENLFGPLANIQADFSIYHFELCMVHQVIYADLSRKNTNGLMLLNAFRDSLKPPPEELEDEEREWILVSQTRELDKFMNLSDTLNRTKQFADQHSVIGLWAITERFLGRTYSSIVSIRTSVDVKTVKTPYRWEGFAKEFDALSIDLHSLHGATDADECRVLNNTLKHSEWVDKRLGSFPFFAPYVGHPVRDIKLEMQRYATGIYHFCSSLIEAGNKLLESKFGS